MHTAAVPMRRHLHVNRGSSLFRTIDSWPAEPWATRTTAVDGAMSVSGNGLARMCVLQWVVLCTVGSDARDQALQHVLENFKTPEIHIRCP